MLPTRHIFAPDSLKQFENNQLFLKKFNHNPIAFFEQLLKDNPKVALSINELIQNRDYADFLCVNYLPDLERDFAELDFLFDSKNYFSAYKALRYVFGQEYLNPHSEIISASDTTAAYCFIRAAKAGCERSAVEAEKLFLEGRGVNKINKFTADFAREILTKNGSLVALYQLGVLNNQLNFSKNKEQVEDALHIATRNDPTAWFQLGIFHSQFEAHQDASFYFNEAEKTNDPNVLRLLGELYFYGNTAANISKDHEKAKFYFYQKLNLPPDDSLKQTLEFLKEIEGALSLENDSSTLCLLGMAYLNTSLSETNKNEYTHIASTYLHEACKKENSKAYFLLGNAYFCGLFSIYNEQKNYQPVTQSVTPKKTNLLIAEEYLEKAANSGIPEATGKLNELRSIRTWSWSMQGPFDCADKLVKVKKINPELLKRHIIELNEAVLAGFPDAIFQAETLKADILKSGSFNSATCDPETAYQVGLIYQSQEDSWLSTASQDKARKWFEVAFANSNKSHADAIFALAEIHYSRISLFKPHHKEKAYDYYKCLAKFKDHKHYDHAVKRANELFSQSGQLKNSAAPVIQLQAELEITK